MEHPPDLPCELLALNEPPATGESNNYGVAPIFSVSVGHLGVALAGFLYASRVRVRAY